MSTPFTPSFLPPSLPPHPFPQSTLVCMVTLKELKHCPGHYHCMTDRGGCRDISQFKCLTSLMTCGMVVQWAVGNKVEDPCLSSAKSYIVQVQVNIPFNKNGTLQQSHVSSNCHLLSFLRLFEGPSPRKIEKLKTLLCYFRRVTQTSKH